MLPNSEINSILLSLYGIKAGIKKLPGYEDLNFLLDLGNQKLILKINPDPESADLAAAQTRIIDHLNNNKNLNPFLPKILPGLNGEKMQFYHSEGKKLPVRLLTFLEGSFLAERQTALHFFSDYGSFTGLLDKELSALNEPIFRTRELEWDLANFPGLAGLTCNIVDPYKRTIVEYFLMQFREKIVPCYPRLRKSLIHNDLNDWNLLVDNDKVTGLIDFGDMVFSATVNEPAIALAYAMMDKEDPLEVGGEFIRAYHSILPLQKEEIEILYYLVAARLSTTLIMSAKKSRENPGYGYHQVSAVPAWTLLKKWLRTGPVRVSCYFLNICGYAPPPHGKKYPELLADRYQFIPKSLSVSYSEPIVMRDSALQYMYDAEGNTYLDGVNNIPHAGHCHPRIFEAGRKQMASLNTNTRYLYPSLNRYAERLTSKFPEPLNKVIFVNSGSAATDLAVRLARAHTGKNEFIVLDHAYHGNSPTAAGLSPYKFNRPGSPGKPENVHVAEIPDPYRGKYRLPGNVIPGSPEHSHESGIIGKKYAKDLEGLLDNNPVLRSGLAGFIAESIPGCGGQIVLPENYLGEVYKTIRKHGGLCIADEVQTGFGRVGSKFWGFELYGVVPDIVILGKPMGNGHPVGAVVFTDEISASFEKGPEFFSSFGGNPVSCEIGLALLDAIEHDCLQENALHTGDHLMNGLLKLKEEDNAGGKGIIGDIRGKGLFIGIEIVNNIDTREPDTDMACRLVEEMKKSLILLSTDGPHNNVIKFKPTLCFTMENADELLEKLTAVILKNKA